MDRRARLAAGQLVTPLVGHADRSIGRNSETNTGNLICAALTHAAKNGIVSAQGPSCERHQQRTTRSRAPMPVGEQRQWGRHVPVQTRAPWPNSGKGSGLGNHLLPAFLSACAEQTECQWRLANLCMLGGRRMPPSTTTKPTLNTHLPGHTQTPHGRAPPTPPPICFSLFVLNFCPLCSQRQRRFWLPTQACPSCAWRMREASAPTSPLATSPWRRSTACFPLATRERRPDLPCPVMPMGWLL